MALKSVIDVGENLMVEGGHNLFFK